MIESTSKSADYIDENGNFIIVMFKFSKRLLSSPMFRILLAIYCLGNTAILTFGSMINIISGNFGFSSSIVSLIAFVVITLGLISSVLYSIYFICLLYTSPSPRD